GILSCSLTLTSTSAIASSLVAHLIIHHLHLVACHLHLVACHPVLRHSLALPTVQLVTHRYHSIPHRTRLKFVLLIVHQLLVLQYHCALKLGPYQTRHRVNLNSNQEKQRLDLTQV
ncbi:hypothetical protein F5880DRAFT_1561390, partial [Lentinula raphanica]